MPKKVLGPNWTSPCRKITSTAFTLRLWAKVIRLAEKVLLEQSLSQHFDRDAELDQLIAGIAYGAVNTKAACNVCTTVASSVWATFQFRQISRKKGHCFKGESYV